jgi:hypothetical protein
MDCDLVVLLLDHPSHEAEVLIRCTSAPIESLSIAMRPCLSHYA